MRFSGFIILISFTLCRMVCLEGRGRASWYLPCPDVRFKMSKDLGYGCEVCFAAAYGKNVLDILKST